jgi:uncharacterized protein YgiM (DUF1202 family)
MWSEVKRWVIGFAVAVALGLDFSPVQAQTPAAVPAPADKPAERAADGERVQVADAFLELHTGPGRGYPVFHVAARGEWVAITLRHTDWFQVRTDKGVEGWVLRRQP